MVEYKVGIVADLHLDDRVVGQHKNYYANCLDICDKITKLIEDNKLTHLIFLGDLFGNSQHIVQRQSARVSFTEYFAKWNNLVGGNLYSVIGNHDKGAYATDFDLLVTSGLLKIPSMLDVGCYRFHFLNYGESNRDLELSEDKENIVLAHEHFTIEGQTGYIKARGGLELSDMGNLAGVSLVVCGHIHNPSYSYLQTRINNKAVGLYYPGCPTRPSKERDLWDNAYMLVMTSTQSDDLVTGEVEEQAVEIPLVSKDELFKESLSSVNPTDLIDGADTDVEGLREILQNLEKYSITVKGGYREQVRRFGAADEEATKCVLNYIEKAEQETSQTNGVNPA